MLVLFSLFLILNQDAIALRRIAVTADKAWASLNIGIVIEIIR
jgi:hypothetical protein